MSARKKLDVPAWQWDSQNECWCLSYRRCEVVVARWRGEYQWDVWRKIGTVHVAGGDEHRLATAKRIAIAVIEARAIERGEKVKRGK